MASAAGGRAHGDAREAFAEFYRRHEPWLRATIRTRRVGRLIDRDEGVKDVVQTTFQLAYRGAATFRLERLKGRDARAAARRVRAWLGGIANRVISDLLRRQVPTEELDAERELDPSTPLEALEPEEPTPLIGAMEAELQALPERERDVLLADLDHKSGAANDHLPRGVAQALAERWHTTPENIRQVRSRTRKRLKERLSRFFN